MNQPAYVNNKGQVVGFDDIDEAIEKNTIQTIKDHAVYQQVVKDAFGGVMYNVDNRNKYDSKEIIALWDSLTPAQRESADGIITGAMHFLKGDF